MGYRLHVRTLNRIEYGDGWFNHHDVEINTLLAEICHNQGLSMTTAYGVEKCYATTIEMPKDDFKKLIDYIKSNKKTIQEIMTAEDFDFDFDIKYLIKGLESFYKNSDKKNEFIVLDWF